MMRFAIAAALLIFSAPSFSANLDPVTTVAAGQNQMHLYIDSDSIKVDPANRFLVTAWVITDFGSQDDGVSSIKTLWTYDCKNHSARWHRVVKYSEPNATGKETLGKENSKTFFKPIVPGSIGNTVLWHLCR
ncbi:MAG: hypothetical protein JSR34_02650 [Proteobacteria bacterium]|nr:hypothetical protein [Pseudomonadota bacterium]